MDSPIADSLVQVAASKAVTVLVRQYVPLFFLDDECLRLCVVSPRRRLPWYLILDVLSCRRYPRLKMNLLARPEFLHLYTPPPSVLLCASRYLAPVLYLLSSHPR